MAYGLSAILPEACVRYVSAPAMEVGSRFALPPHTECTQARQRLPREDSLAVKKHARARASRTRSAHLDWLKPSDNVFEASMTNSSRAGLVAAAYSADALPSVASVIAQAP
jgi:hypothetical protein